MATHLGRPRALCSKSCAFAYVKTARISAPSKTVGGPALVLFRGRLRIHWRPLLISGRLRYLGKEPGAPFGLVDPILDQARGGYIVVLFTNFMGLAQEAG
jgi:hypothetical protein